MKYIFGFLLGCMVCAIITIYSRPTALDLPEEIGEAVAGDTMYYTIQDGTMFIRNNLHKNYHLIRGGNLAYRLERL